MRHILPSIACALLLACAAAVGDEPSSARRGRSISQHGITWTFDRDYVVGQFVNGDWWVVGPARVVSVSPAPGKATPEEKVNARTDAWGNTGLSKDDRLRNGSMINPRGGGKQAYDSRVGGCDPAMCASFPAQLKPGQSLVSTASHLTVPNQNFFPGHAEKTNSVLRAAAVLTCLDKEPPAGTFRPPYAGDEKPLHRARRLQRNRLLKLKPTKSAPSMDLYARCFQRVWLDHVSNWSGRMLHPTENMPDYGREFARMVSIGALMVHLDAPADRRLAQERLLIGFIQVGIDLYGVSRAGGSWMGCGGHMSGRKWPILFAGLMLGEAGMTNLPAALMFGEDMQTYYGAGWTRATALYQMIDHHGPRTPYEHLPPAKWAKWDWTSEGYRRCCTSSAWIGQALAARLMGAVNAWNHDAFFDYCDRWMSEDETEALKTLKALGHDYGKPWVRQGRSWDEFVNEMWAACRSKAPKQPGGARNEMWLHKGGTWTTMPNPKPVSRPQ